MATEGLKDVEVSLMSTLYHSSRCMPLFLDPVLRSLVTAGFVEGLSLVGLLVGYMGTRTDSDEPTGTNRVQL